MTSLLLLALLTQAPKTTAKPGKEPPYAQAIQGVTGGVPIPISGSVSSTGAADTVGSAGVLDGANDTCEVSLAGQGGAGMFLSAGTLAATLTPELSADNGTTWTATSFIDKDGAKSATLAFTNPNAATQTGIVVLGGSRKARVKVTSFTSGSATCTLVATTATSAGAASSGGATQYDEDTASAVAESVMMVGAVRKDARASNVGTDGDRAELQVNASGDLRVDGSAVTQPVSGTVSVTDGAGALNVIVDSGALTATVTDGAGALNVIVDSGALTATVTDGAGALNVIVDSITAGDNNIGNVDIVTLPALVAGNANIGDVDVATLPNVTIGTFPDNEPFNVAQINGVTPLMGNGASGTGALRVSVASDSTGQIRIADDGGNQIPSSTSQPATTVRGLNTRNVHDDPCATKLAVPLPISLTANTQLVAAVASQHVYICQINLVAAAATNVGIVAGTGSVCATSTAGVFGGATAATGWNLAANGGVVIGDGGRTIGRTETAADALCLFVSAANQVSGSIMYVQQ